MGFQTGIWFSDKPGSAGSLPALAATANSNFECKRSACLRAGRPRSQHNACLKTSLRVSATLNNLSDRHYTAQYLNLKTVFRIVAADHAGGNGVVGGFVDQNKRAGGRVFAVGGGVYRLLQYDAQVADVVDGQFIG